MKRAISVVLQLSLLVGATTVAIGTIPAHAATVNPCGDTVFPGNDDGSAGPVSTGFDMNFFGTTYSDLYVNNNGNVTFGNSLGSFSPGPIVGGNTPIIAPFWADVDTEVGNEVTYGTTTVGSNNAFCVTWPMVGYYNNEQDKLNDFQVILVDRSDVDPGDFDIIFNYHQIQWETGDASGGTDGLGGDSARAGYSDGQSGGTSYEFPGSGENGALIDSGPEALITQTNDGTPGQDTFQVRNGTPLSPPVFTSPNSASFTQGEEGSFTVSTTGNPTPSLQLNGDDHLPDGLNFVDNEDGTGTLSGTPGAGTASSSPYDEQWIASNSSGNTDQDFTLTVDPPHTSADLTLTKSASPNPVTELNPITYTLDAGNTGDGDANDAVVTDNLPSGTVFDSASTTQGSCSLEASTVTCDLGTLSADGSATVTITVQAPNVSTDTTITNNASMTSSNADTVNASADTLVQPNQGGSEQGNVPPNTTVPLTFTTSTQSNGGNPGVNGSDPTAVSLIVPPGGPGGNLTLQELPCTVAPCDGPSAHTNAVTANTTKVVLGGVVFNVVPPPNYPRNTPFRAVLFYDKTLHAKQGPVFYFKQGVTPTEIKLAHCGTKPPNGGKPCVLFNAKVTKGNSLVKGDWKVVVRLSSDPHMRR